MEKYKNNMRTKTRRGHNRGGGFGPGGYCICANCGKRIPHQKGTKCTEVKCTVCHHTMVRKELLAR